MKLKIILAGLFLSSLNCFALISRKPAVVAETSQSVQEAFVNNVREQLSIAMNAPAKDFQITVDSFKMNPEVEVKNVKSVQVLGLGTKRIDGLFSYPIIVQTENISQEFHVTGILKVIGPVHVARRSLIRGETVAETDLNLITLPWSQLPTGAAAIPARVLLGQRVKAHVQSGDPVYPLLLDEPFAVHNGDMVELTLLSGPGVMIRSRAVAKQEGRIGDTIRLEQPDTKKAISGQIVGTKSVEVRL